jgi:hypothetical protein
MSTRRCCTTPSRRLAQSLRIQRSCAIQSHSNHVVSDSLVSIHLKPLMLRSKVCAPSLSLLTRALQATHNFMFWLYRHCLSDEWTIPCKSTDQCIVRIEEGLERRAAWYTSRAAFGIAASRFVPICHFDRATSQPAVRAITKHWCSSGCSRQWNRRCCFDGDFFYHALQASDAWNAANANASHARSRHVDCVALRCT